METPFETTRSTEQIDHHARLAELIDSIELEEYLRPAAFAAIDWYTDDLPYHNIEHMFEVTENVLALCKEHGIVGNERQIVFMAALWHDAAYPLPLEEYETSKEHRSALLAYEAIMAQVDPTDTELYAQTQIFDDGVASIIISSQHGRIPEGILEYILNTADIKNLSGSVVEMLKKSLAFYLEGKQMAGEQFIGSVEQYLSDHIEDFTGWCETTQGILEGLVSNKLGASTILETVRDNVKKITPANIFELFRNSED